MRRFFTLCLSLLFAIVMQAQDNGQFFKKMSGQNISAENVEMYFSEWFSLPAATEWREVSRTTDFIGMDRIEYRQYVAGVEVEHSQVLVHAKDGKVLSVNGTVMEASRMPAKVRQYGQVYKNGTPTDMMGQELLLINTTEGYRYAYKIASADKMEQLYYDADTQEIIKRVPIIRGDQPIEDRKTTVRVKSIFSGSVDLDATIDTDGSVYLYDQDRNIHTLCAAYLPTFDQLIEQGRLYEYFPQGNLPDNPEEASEEDFSEWINMVIEMSDNNELSNLSNYITDNCQYIKDKKGKFKAYKLNSIVFDHLTYTDEFGELQTFIPNENGGFDDDDDDSGFDDDDDYDDTFANATGFDDDDDDDFDDDDDDDDDEEGSGYLFSMKLLYGADLNNISIGEIESIEMDFFDLPKELPLSAIHEDIPTNGATLIFTLTTADDFDYINVDTLAVIPIIPNKSGVLEFTNDRVSLSLDYEESGNPMADIHWGMEKTIDFYREVFGRNSYDGEGSPVYNLVYNPGENENSLFAFPRCNAAALASQEPYPMIYGMGGLDFMTLMKPVVELTVMAHEFTHIVTEQTAKLEYAGESGALNESFSDIMGISVKKYVKNSDDWFIGGGGQVLTMDMQEASNLRDMADPENNMDGEDPGPDTYGGENWADPTLIDDDNDYGGVHQNSSVQNKWYFLLTDGGSGTNDNGDDYDVQGIGIEKARQIAYLTLTSYATRQSDYKAICNASLEAAEVLFGNDSPECQAVSSAWYAVGVSKSRQGVIDGIAQVNVKEQKASQVYDLQGRLINGRPTQQGIYIINGKKMVIK